MFRKWRTPEDKIQAQNEGVSGEPIGLQIPQETLEKLKKVGIGNLNHDEIFILDEGDLVDAHLVDLDELIKSRGNTGGGPER